jgi:hypothetical protein
MTLRAVVTSLAIGLAACSGGDDTPDAPELPRTAADSAAADAQILGDEITRLLDLAADYRSSHRGRAPRSLRDLATDSLTPTLARSVRAGGNTSYITVAFRNPVGRRYRSCTGDLSVLESAGIGGGDYQLSCIMPDGTTQQVRVGGVE